MARSLLLLAFWLVLVPPAGAAALPASPLGINLSAVEDYSDEDPFTDFFKMSREWLPQCVVGADPGCTSANAWDTGEQALIQRDGSGWVTRLPASGDTAPCSAG
jgi:hypothetical protein